MQRLLAKALYDNIAESPDELAFKRGDVITVLEQETNGLEGWWLCSLRGRQGIAPGNRLKLMSNLVANHIRSHTSDFPLSANQKSEQEWNRRSWDGSTNKVVTPNRQGNMFMYDQSQGQSDYDVPPTRYPNASSNMCNASGTSSNHSSKEDLLNASASSFEQSFYDTPPQGRSFNRSQDLSLYDTPPSQLHLDPYDMPSGSVRTSLASKFSDESMSLSSGMSKSNPPSMCDSARSSMDISPMDMYDVPPSQRERETREANRAALYTIQSSKDSGLDMYDSPPKMKSPPSMLEDYDVPKLVAINKEREQQFRNLQFPRSEPTSPGDFLEDYDVPKSFPGGAFPDKKSHDMKLDISQSDTEDYDVPKQHPHPVVGKPPIAGKARRHKSNSLGSLLDDYDTPQSRLQENVSKDDLFTKAMLREKYKREFSDDENNYDEPDAQDNGESSEQDRGKLQKQEHAIDDLYDSPRNNAPVKNMTKEFSALSVTPNKESLGVYDIPPQVTRDSVISSRSDSSDGNENGNYRLSTCSTDSRGSDILIYDELPLDRDAAIDLVIKQQQDVQKAVNRFLQNVHSSWRKRENLEAKLYEIKVSTTGVEETLCEFVEFGQGTLANSAKLSDRKLINKLSKYLIPLQQALQQIRICIKHLDDADWRVSKLISSDNPKKDDLGIIVSLTKDLTADVRKLASFIEGNSSLLFKRAKDFNRGSRNMDHSTPPSAGKPPINRKPVLPIKSNIIVQARPLPAPPPTERPLPPTPTDKKSMEFGFSGTDIKRLSGDFSNKRHSGDYKHWSGDIQVKRLSVDSDRSSYKSEDLIQEYDYVELEEEEEKQENDSNNKGEKGAKIVADLEKVMKDTNMKVNDSYEKEMEQTLDEIDGVNIYSDDSGGTLKRDTKLIDIENVDSEGEHDTGTLKRKTDSEDMLDSREADSGTLKRQDKPIEEQTTQESDKHEVPEHDKEPTKLQPLDMEDKQVLSFYSEQLDTHLTLLTNSIDAFFSCVEKNEAPKVFISHSKFVVVSAHKLVYIGDSLHRNLKHDLVRSKIIQCANILCDRLKLTVTSTKTAALQYPSVPAVQDMVDRVVDVSHASHNLKLLVTQASKL